MSLRVLLVNDQQVVRGMVARSLDVSGTTFVLFASVFLTAAWRVSKHWKCHKVPLERHV